MSGDGAGAACAVRDGLSAAFASPDTGALRHP
jgi:hypothetical protein